jgi:DNA-binding NtrC family response regulator
MTSSPPDRIRRLLVVDDDSELLALHGIAFGVEFSVRLSSSPSEALAVLATEDFDAVLSDFRMPIHDGAWLLRQTERLHPEVRRFLMSTLAPFEVAAWLSAGLIEQFFPKPVSAAQLVEHFAERATVPNPRGKS